MLARFKKLLFTPLVTVALFTATVGIQPASFFLWYQPEGLRVS
jgi:cyclic lactone autoinducer peptide